MVRVNGKEYEVYLMDTPKTFKERVASRLKTIPKYLYFPDSIKLDDPNAELRAIDVHSIIKNAESYTDFSKLLQDLQNVNLSRFDVLHDIIRQWVFYHSNLNVLEDQVKLALVHDINDSLNSNYSYDDIWSKLNSISGQFKSQQKSNDSKVQIRDTLFQKFDLIDTGVEMSDFIVENSVVRYDLESLEIKDISLMEIFNILFLNTRIPYTCYNNFFKILKDFTPYDSWIDSDKETIIFKLLERKNMRSLDEKHYTDGNIVMSKDMKPQILIRKNVISANISDNEMMSSISRLFQNKIQLTNFREEEVVGIFYIPKQRLNKYIFADLVMNDPIFYNFLYIDEREKTTKDKTELILKFNHKSGLVTANIIERIREKNDDMSSFSFDDYPIGQPYLRIHVMKAKNTEVINDFMKTFAKLIQYYNDQKNSISKIYTKYIPNFEEKFGDIKTVKRKAKKTTSNKPKNKHEIIRIKDVFPSLFPIRQTDYRCNNKPRVVAKKDIEGMQQGEYIQFPKDNSVFEPVYFVCDEHKKHKFPGLKANPYDQTNDEFPYLPCCYEENQMQEGKTAYKYYNNIQDEKDIATYGNIQNLIITNKFSRPRGLAVLPEPILKFFESSDIHGTYYRTGVTRSKSSFIECVMEALAIDEFEDIVTDINERTNIVSRKRLKLAELAANGICRQEMYDMSPETIKQYIEDLDEYLDPRLVIRLFEHLYQCKIYLFTRDDTGSRMILPRHYGNYLSYTTNERCIFIYEHVGAQVGTNIYPQCEVIVKWSEKETEYSFGHNDTINISAAKIFNNMCESYNLDKRILSTIIFPVINNNVSNISIDSQVIDSHGKTRILYISYNNELITILTDPLPPLYVKETKLIDISYCDKDTILSLISSLGGTVKSQGIKDGQVVEINAKLGNVNITVPISSNEKIGNVSQTESLSFMTKHENSILESYRKNKKLARYLTEYVFWYFSKYMYENNITEPTDEDIKAFVIDNTVLDKNFVYSDIYRIFTMSSSIFRGNRIVMNSAELRRRIMYVLRLEIQRNLKGLLLYRNKDTISHYYLDLSDFDQNSEQAIVYGEESVRNWIYEKERGALTLRHRIDPYSHEPYFFTNKNIDSRMYLAQNMMSYQGAIDITKTWYEDGYNPRLANVLNTNDISFILYAYQNENNIKSYVIEGINTSYPIEIAGYRYYSKENPELLNTGYTSLMPINN